MNLASSCLSRTDVDQRARAVLIDSLAIPPYHRLVIVTLHTNEPLNVSSAHEYSNRVHEFSMHCTAGTGCAVRDAVSALLVHYVHEL